MNNSRICPPLSPTSECPEGMDPNMWKEICAFYKEQDSYRGIPWTIKGFGKGLYVNETDIGDMRHDRFYISFMSELEFISEKYNVDIYYQDGCVEYVSDVSMEFQV